MGRIGLKMVVPHIHSVRGGPPIQNVVRQIVQKRAYSHFKEIKTWQQHCQ